MNGSVNLQDVNANCDGLFQSIIMKTSDINASLDEQTSMNASQINGVLECKDCSQIDHSVAPARSQIRQLRVQ